MKPHSGPMKTQTIFHSSTPSASYAEKSPGFLPFPPRKRRAFHDAVLDEILQERVSSSRNRRNPRCVKRKMSNFPLRRKTATQLKPIDDATRAFSMRVS